MTKYTTTTQQIPAPTHKAVHNGIGPTGILPHPKRPRQGKTSGFLTIAPNPGKRNIISKAQEIFSYAAEPRNHSAAAHPGQLRGATPPGKAARLTSKEHLHHSQNYEEDISKADPRPRIIESFAFEKLTETGEPAKETCRQPGDSHPREPFTQKPKR
jgi:hypothetical protein